MDIRRIPIAHIEPAHYNPRIDLKPGDEDYDLLAKGMEEFGLVEPLVWNERTGRLVGGHQRLKILVDIGVTEADVSVVNLDETREKALNVALNKIGGDWDRPKLKDLLEEIDTGALDMDLTGWTEDALAELMEAVPPIEPAIDVVPEQWMVLIECDGEEHQTAILDRLIGEGYKCRALVS